MPEKWEPRYSGPNRTGICKCGHSWQEHHLGVVMNQNYVAQTGEAYAPGECEHYGPNELGGSMPAADGQRVDHCYAYRDEKD